MSYTKLHSALIHSTIWREDNATRIVWITMLAMADQDGVVEASIPGLADAARVTLAETEAALTKLMAPDPYSRSKKLEGRRVVEVDGGWQLVTYQEQRSKSSPEQRREKARERKRQQRERERGSGHAMSQRDVTPVTLGHARSRKSLQAEAEAESEAEDPTVEVEAEPLARAHEAPTPASATAADSESLQTRASRILANPYDGAWQNPQDWPEVVEIAEHLAAETGKRPPRLGGYSRDRGVQAVVGLFADGWSVAELRRAVSAAVRSDWWRAGSRGLASLTPEVVRRALDEAGCAPAPADTVAKRREADRILAKIQAEKEARDGAPDPNADPADVQERLRALLGNAVSRPSAPRGGVNAHGHEGQSAQDPKRTQNANERAS